MKRGGPLHRVPEEDVIREVDDELAFHFEERVRDYMSRGMDESAARAAAHERLGDLSSVRREYASLVAGDRRAKRRRIWLEDLRRDLGFGVRAAARAPLFTLVTVLTLALGIGVNAAVFGVLKAVLLDALPYERSDELVRVYSRSQEGGELLPLSRGEYADHVERQQSFERTGAFYPATYDVIHRPPDGPQVRRGALVEPGFFETLGTRPALGRLFTREEVESDAYVVMISYATWRGSFGEDPAVIGRTLRIDADSWQIVGVLPADFVGPMGSADFWFGMEVANLDPASARRTRGMGYVGRLRDGVSVAAAQRELSAISLQLAQEYPLTDEGRDVSVVSIRESMAGETRTPLLLLMGSAALVLLITCANLASALLSRAITRRQEFAVRSALGAGRSRLVRQLVTESVLLSMAGALAGLLLATSGLGMLRQLSLPMLPAYADLSLDVAVVIATTLVALLTGVAVGVAPAFAAQRSSGGGSLPDGRRGGGEDTRSRNLRGMLVAGQVALCASLLMGATLLGRSLIAMTSKPFGYDPSGVLALSVKGPIPATDADRGRFFHRLEEEAGLLPGTNGSAFTSQLPSSPADRAAVVIEGINGAGPEAPMFLPATVVSDAYFDVMRIPLLAGRTFGPQDAGSAPSAVVINSAMARRFWPGARALGARLRVGADEADAESWGVVVGIVGDVRSDPALTLAEPAVYLPARQSPLRSSLFYLIRGQGDVVELVDPFRAALIELDPGVPMDEVGTLEARLAARFDVQRLPTLLLGSFALLALALAAVGVYSLFSSLTNSRRQEFGVRLALGSSPWSIAGLVVKQGGTWALVGLAGGALGIALVGRALRGLLFDVAPLDPLAIALSITLLVFVGALALLSPVRRAARTEAVEILR